MEDSDDVSALSMDGASAIAGMGFARRIRKDFAKMQLEQAIQEGEQLLKTRPEVDLVMGPQYANRIGDLLEEVISGNQVVATEATRIRYGRAEPETLTGVLEWIPASVHGRLRRFREFVALNPRP